MTVCSKDDCYLLKMLKHTAKKMRIPFYNSVRTRQFLRIFIEINVIKWFSNPPSAPHFGGSWERLVRSVKITLSAIIPDRNPNDKMLQLKNVFEL